MTAPPSPLASTPGGARWAAPLGLLGVLLTLFAPALMTGRLLAYGDALAQDFPLRLLVAEAWRQGVVPFWNPFGFSGQPLWAVIHVGVLFPGNWPYLCLPPVAAHNTSVLLAFWVAGLGAYALGRALALSRLAAFVTGLVFMLSGFLVSHIENLQMLQAAALLPGLLWAVARFATTLKPRYAAMGALLLALQVLAGHPQMVVFSGLLVASYALWRWGGLARPLRGRYLGHLALMAGLGLGLAALQLAPTLDFIPTTQRAAITYDTLVFRALPPRQAVTFAFPFFFGGQPTSLFPQAYWGGVNRTELTGYAGLVSLILLLVALAAARRRPEALFWGGAALVALLLAMGGATPLYAVWAQLPLLNALPAPGRHLLEVDMALAVLAGLGFEAWRTAPGRGALAAWALLGLPVLAVWGFVTLRGADLARRLQPLMPEGLSLEGAFDPLAPALLVPACLWLGAGLLLLGARRRPGALWAYALAAWLTVDLGVFTLHQGWRTLSLVPPSPLAPAAWPLPGRLLPLSAYPVYPYEDLAHVRAMRYPNWGALAGVRSVTGYDAFIPARYAKLVGEMGSTGKLKELGLFKPSHHALDLVGCDGVLVDRRLGSAVMAPLAATPTRWKPAPDPAPGLALYRNARVLPAAWRVSRVDTLAPGAVDQRVTGDLTFDPATVALVEAPAPPGEFTPGPTTLTRLDLNTRRVSTMGPGPGFVVLAEGFDPGWRAWLGDTELPVVRVDALIMGVAVPSGPHEVVWRYRPRLFAPGLALSLLSALGLAVWLWLTRRTPGVAS